MLFNSETTLIKRGTLDLYLKELAKEFKRLNGSKAHAEIVLIGGGAVLANYNFRESSGDIDGLINANASLKMAINTVGDRHKLRNFWLNDDFMKTDSYSDKLFEVSARYKDFNKVLMVRTVSGEYLIAMKLMSGRQYKYDFSDVIGILMEHQISNNPITRDKIDNAISYLYSDPIPEHSIIQKIRQKNTDGL